jgi:TolB-like protein
MRIVGLLVLGVASLCAQVRVAVLPVKNLDGNMQLLTYSYAIADSLRALLVAHPEHGRAFVVVPADTVEQVLSEFSLDPTSPQFESDLWRAIAKLNCTYAITGSFEITGGRMVLNLYAYDVATKLADQTNAARNLFKAPEHIFEVLPIAVRKLVPALK